MSEDRVVRIIPKLDVKGPHLVKGIHLEGLRALGFPEDFSKRYYQEGADELIFQDVVASLFERNNLKDIISQTAKDMFIPLTVGGGLRSIDDIKNTLRAGADKVSINTAALKNPAFIKEAAMEFGSSTIVTTIETIKQKDGTYKCFTDNGREYTDVNAVEWAQEIEDLGAGEIMITSVDNEGRGDGFDIEITKMICDAVSIPVIAHGGAGDYEAIERVIKETDVTGVALASMLHYDFIKTYERDFSKETEGNFEFMKKPMEERLFGKINSMSLPEIKNRLRDSGIKVR